jgi:hypothetical protein
LQLLPFYFLDLFGCYINCCTTLVETVSFWIHIFQHQIKFITLVHWPSFPHFESTKLYIYFKCKRKIILIS